SGNDRTIILGITPRSLTPMALGSNGFLSWSSASSFDRAAFRLLGNTDRFFASENPSLLFGRPLFGSPRYWQEEHLSGWMPAGRLPEDVRASVQEYQDLFASQTVSEDAVTVIAEEVRIWTNEGIRAYVFRPPTSNVVLAIENQRSGFDEPRVRQLLESR